MSNEVLRESKNGVVTITINRPDDGNKVSDPMASALADMITEEGQTAHIIVLKGSGKDFCLGRAQMGRPAGATGGPPDVLDLRDANDATVFKAYGAFRGSKAPVVGVVQGQALGFGCALAAACDITIASENAQFQLPEMGHNIMPTMAMSSMVDRTLRKALNYLTWSTELIDAQTAFSYGIVSRVVPAAQLNAKVDELIATMSKQPVAATYAVKEFTRSAMHMDIGAATDYARNLHALVNSSARLRRPH
jgi:enoyl-CoA hydratase